MVADPLHLLDICATSDGGAAIILTSMEYARKKGIVDPVRIKAISTVTPTFPDDQACRTSPGVGVRGPRRSARSRSRSETPPTRRPASRRGRRRRRGLRPRHVRRTRWIEDLGLCKRGEAEHLLRAGDTTIGGRIPVNPSGGLACFGEAVPAQALAQVCELTWQLRGQAEGRQVEGARVGITATQGLFGHGSSVIVSADPRRSRLEELPPSRTGALPSSRSPCAPARFE
ncbi:hypothetical protein GS941_25140 [Rhodococcus hoagii]|nr:hypothetical protein [Prescottella equi]